MLVLTRKAKEEIVIGNTIRLTVLSVRGSRVQLGVSAPSNVSIRRNEIGPRKMPDATIDPRHAFAYAEDVRS